MKRKDTQNSLSENDGFYTSNNHKKIEKLVTCSVLISLVVILQILSSNIRFGQFSITLALIPIIIGAILLGPSVGAILGFVMGIVVVIFDSASFFVINPFYTIVICLTKSTVAGFVTGLIYKVLSNKNTRVAIIVSALVCPIINTGLFAIGCVVFFYNTLVEWAGGTNALNFLFLSIIGINFVVEFIVISILSPTIVFLIKTLNEKKNNN